MSDHNGNISLRAFKVVILYTIVSILYILFSDYILEKAVQDVDLLTKIQTYKGLGFVSTTAALLYLLVKRHLRSLSVYNKSLLNQEKVYRVMLENNNDIILNIDITGRVVFCSNNLKEITGYSYTDINALDINALIHPDDIELLVKCWHDAMTLPRRQFVTEFRVKSKSGLLIWLECSMVNHEADPLIRGVIVNAHNIDKRKTDEELLRKSEDKYAKLFNSSPLPVWIYDVETLQFVDVNEAAVFQYGYSREEFLTMTLRDIRPADELGKLMDAVNRAKDKIHNDNKQAYRHLKKNGDIIFVRIESIAINLENKNYRMALAIDMTELLRQEKELKETNDKLKLAQEIANLGYWSSDANKYAPYYWSSEMYRIFEKNEATYTPNYETVLNAVHPDDRYLLSGEYEIEQISQGVYEVEFRIITPSGITKWLFCRIKQTLENDRLISRDGVVVDITRRKRDEEAIIRKSKLLNALNKFTTSLLTNENWVAVFDRSMGIVAETLKLDKIFYFEIETEATTDVPFACLKQQWAVTEPERAKLYPALQKIPFSNNREVINVLEKGLPFEQQISSVPDGDVSTALSYAGVKTFYLQPVFVAGKFHGAFGFFDCQNERVWQDDEKLFVESLVSNVATKIEKYIVENEVQIAKEQFESVITNLPGIAMRRRAVGDWPVIFVNDEIERLTGYPATEFINNGARTFESLIHPDDRDKKVKTIRGMQPGASFTLDFRLICKDGNIIWLRGYGRAIAGADNKVAFIDEVLIDATEANEKKQQLIISNERFRTVMKAAAEAIIDWDIVNNTVIWGDGFKEFFGYDLNVYDNILWSRNIHPDDKAWVTALMDASVRDSTKENFYAEFRFLKADRTIAYVQNRCTFIRDENGRALRAIGALADVTESVQYRMKIEIQNESLKEIAWIQSHVIRAPLATLLGLMSLFKERKRIDLDEDDLVDKIMVSANSIDKVIHEVVRKSEAVSSL